MARAIAAVNRLLFAVLIPGCAPTQQAGLGDTGSSAGQAGFPFTACGGEAGNAGDAGDVGDAGSRGCGTLINGVDLAVWDRYLGKPTTLQPALGIDNDPLGVYSIVSLEGEPAIRISGEVWGSLISKRDFCNFRLRAEFKWGSAVWPPLNEKDSGIMFLSTGPLGAVNAGGNTLSDPIGSGAFMVAAEYQIAGGDVGSLYNLGPIAFSRKNSGQHQAAPGVWNSVEISLLDDQASLFLNGQQTVRASGFVLSWPDQPPSALRCGKLQVQSEGAEIFFRRLEIEALP